MKDAIDLFQVAELTRLGQTLLLVESVHWIVAEDSGHCSPLVQELLNRLDLSYTHMVSPQPAMYRRARFGHCSRSILSV